MNLLKTILHHARDPLYKNSFFIMLTSISSAGFGFISSYKPFLVAFCYFWRVFKILYKLISRMAR
jgi:hypothetical protein